MDSEARRRVDQAAVVAHDELEVGGVAVRAWGENEFPANFAGAAFGVDVEARFDVPDEETRSVSCLLGAYFSHCVAVSGGGKMRNAFGARCGEMLEEEAKGGGNRRQVAKQEVGLWRRCFTTEMLYHKIRRRGVGVEFSGDGWQRRNPTEGSRFRHDVN
jgi:hypothetical protein